MFKIDWNKKYTTIATYVTLTVMACALGILILVGLITNGLLFKWISAFFNLISPIIYGFVFAYLLNPLMKFCDRRIFAFVEKKKARRKLRRGLAVTLTYILVLTVITLFILMVVPQIVDSYNDFSSKFQSYIASAQHWADSTVQNLTLFGNFANFNEFVDKTEIANSLSNLITDSGDIFETVTGSVLSYAGKFVVGFKNGLLGAILSVYFLLAKERIVAQTKKLLSAFIKPDSLRRLLSITRHTDNTFGGFITGKILDSIIIGLLTCIVLGIFGFPYYPLISLIIGVTNLIPFVGPIIGAIPSAFIILIADPSKVIPFIIIIILIQQLDGNVIGPKILGESTGLSSMWVIIAIIIAGDILGITGMFIGVPLFAVIYSFIKSWVEGRLQKREMPTATVEYYPDGSAAAMIDTPSENPEEERQQNTGAKRRDGISAYIHRLIDSLKNLFKKLFKRKK